MSGSRLHAVLLGNTDEALFDVVVRSGLDTRANPLDLCHVALFKRETVRRQRVARIFDQPPAELRMLDGTPDHGADHFVAHVRPPAIGGARDEPAQSAMFGLNCAVRTANCALNPDP